MNPGTGLKYFVDNVWENRKYDRIIEGRLMDFLKFVGELEGIDYYAHLMNPDRMLTVKQDDVPPEMGRYIRGQRRGTLPTFLRSQRKREGKNTEATGSHKVKIPPPFNWGDITPR